MTQQLMGANEVRSLVGAWQAIVGDAVVVNPGTQRDDGQRGWGRDRDGDRDRGGGQGRWAGEDANASQNSGFFQRTPEGRFGFNQGQQSQGHHHRGQWERAHPGQDWNAREHRRKHWERRNPGVPFVGVEALVGAWKTIIGKDGGAPAGLATELGIPPRNLMIEQGPPQFARREALPLNSGDVAVHTGGTLQITSRPQRPAFRPERFFVSAPVGGDIAETASSWIINDITIGNKSQYAQAGQLPGDMFSSTAIDSFISFDTVQTAMDVVIVTTYIGTSGIENPVRFVGGMLGTSAVHC